jgi:hypothetical protein
MAHEGVPPVVIQRQLGHYARDLVKRRVRWRAADPMVGAVWGARRGQVNSSANVA